jgi:sigma-B regulation protein RsbU (phosphoserine phosphatase)
VPIFSVESDQPGDPVKAPEISINARPDDTDDTVSIVVNGKKIDTSEKSADASMVQAAKGAISGGKLPRGDRFYDVLVGFFAPLETTDWQSGKKGSVHIEVTSRPSLLYRRLFITSLEIASIIQWTLLAIASVFAILLLIGFVIALRLDRTITQSIRDLYRGTQEIDRGNFEHRIAVKRKDQLAALSNSFNGMTASLGRLLQEQREKERLQSELAIAQEVQANLFPRSDVSLPSLELHGVCRPARSVSGDYYDFLLFGDRGLGLAIGDISGKGISAALLMASLHSAVRAYRFAGQELVYDGMRAMASASALDRRIGAEEIDCGEWFESPGKVLALLNRHLFRSTQPEKYATLFLAHYDVMGSRLTYANGGQLPPFVLRKDNAVTRLDCGGTVVGLIDNMSYEQETVTLQSGDILIAYSDGVTEPENEFGDFGEERLIEIVRQNRDLPLPMISGEVMQALQDWIGAAEQPDDITLVLARQM